jgi:site-specific DNA-adenine methylase
MTLENHGNNNYSSQSDLKAMRAVGNDRHPHIVHFYAALIDSVDGQLVICMEVLQTSMDKFYSILHSRFKPSTTQLDLLIRRLAKHVCSNIIFIY